MVAVLQADKLPQDVAGEEALLTFHSEHKAEIDARQDSFTSFKKKAEALITARHYAGQEVELVNLIHSFSEPTLTSSEITLGAVQAHPFNHRCLQAQAYPGITQVILNHAYSYYENQPLSSIRVLTYAQTCV